MRFIGTDLHKLLEGKIEIKENPILLTEGDYKLYKKIIAKKYKEMGAELDNKGFYTYKGVEVKQIC